MSEVIQPAQQDKNEDKHHSIEEKFFGLTSNATVKKTAKQDEEPIEIEVVDDTPRQPAKTEQPQGRLTVKRDEVDEEIPDEELEAYEGKVQKRLAKLTYRMREAERKAQESEQIRAEALDYAKRIMAENQRVKEQLNKTASTSLTQAKENAELALKSAKEAYAKAFEAGDTEQVIVAQENMNKAQYTLMGIENRIKQAPPAQPADQQIRPQAQPNALPQRTPQWNDLTPQQQNWFSANPWFQNPKHRDMTAIAFEKHKNLILSGVKVNSDQYYSEIDKEVRKRFPEYFDQAGQGSQQSNTYVQPNVEVEVSGSNTEPQQRQRPASVVAPQVNRNNGTPPRKVQLRASQVKTARALGLTPEQYAAQLVKEGIYDA